MLWQFAAVKVSPYFYFTLLLLVLRRVAAVKVSPYIIIVPVIFYFCRDYLAHLFFFFFFFFFFENQIPLKPALVGGGAWGGGGGRGTYAASQTRVLYMRRLNQTESPILVISMRCLFPKTILFDLYITLL